nr:hypothetical protein [uncultured Devosia sp.]
MPKSYAITRRALIASAGATVATAALAAPYVNAAHLAPAGDERLHQLMAEWRMEYDAVCTTADATNEIHMDRLYAIERETATIRPATLAGFAIKLLLLTNYGDHDLDGPASGLMAEAEAIAGYAPPATFRRS